MQCPKCNYNIDENTKICPNCKKVLQLVCPVCKTINKNNVCKTCGYTILSKCHNCGKINPTEMNVCPNCGMDTYLSIAMNESNINNFACIVLDFPNIAAMQKVFNSILAYQKFQQNLHQLVIEFATGLGLKWQIIDKSFVIKFNRDKSFEDSTYNALNTALELLKLLMNLNVKLHKAHGTLLRCSVTIIKRDISTKMHDFKSGFNIKMMYKDTSENQYHNALQVLVDSSVSDVLSGKVNLTPLGTVLVKDSLVMYFELDVKKYIPIPKGDDKSKEELLKSKLKQISIEELENESNLDDDNIVYNIKKLNFDEQMCDFISVESGNLEMKILETLSKKEKNIISVKSNKKYHIPSVTILRAVKVQNLCQHSIKITCTEDMKYKPYGFFYELLSTICKFSICTKHFDKNNFTKFSEFDRNGVIKSLINYEPIKDVNPEETRDTLFNLFGILFNSLQNSLIYVENFEQIDVTSFEIIQLLLKDFAKYNVNLLLFADEKFSLHKNSHFLLSNPAYTEIFVKTTKFENLLMPQIDLYSNILDSFYMQKIAQYTKGSLLYLIHATNYLMENEILELKNEKLCITKQGTVVLSSSLEKLIESRLRFLSKDKNTFNALALLLYLGPRIDIATLQSLNLNDLGNCLGVLDRGGYIYLEDNVIYFNNYELIKLAMDNVLDKADKMMYAKHLLTNIIDENVTLPLNITVYELLSENQKVCEAWQNLADTNLLMGDFSSYLNCSIVFLKILEAGGKPKSDKSVNECKMIIYENIASLLYKFVPTKIYNISKIVLENIEHSMDDKKVITLCNKMLQCCLRTGNYTQAASLSNKILSRLPKTSVNPNQSNFNPIAFWVSLIKVNIYFNTGELQECINLGEELVQTFTLDNLDLLISDKLPAEQVFGAILDTIGYVCMAKIMQAQDVKPFIKKISTILEVVPESYSYFIYLQKFLKGEDFELNLELANDKDIFSNFILNFLLAFQNLDYDIKLFAKYIYQAKLSAKENNLNQMDLICDLLIGFSYKILNEYDKSHKIYQNVKETATQNGMGNVSMLAWYFIGDLKLTQNQPELGLGIVNNAISLLEKDQNSNEMLIIIFNLLLAKLLIITGENEKATTYYKQTLLLIQKNDLIKNKYLTLTLV